MRRWLPVAVSALLVFLATAAPSNTQPPSPAGDREVSDDSQRLQIDLSQVSNTYANFVRVTGTPEEMILDFGLNPKPGQIPDDPIVINHRIVMNYYSAKRMLAALSLSIQRHEASFGPVETDIRKRMRNAIQ